MCVLPSPLQGKALLFSCCGRAAHPKGKWALPSMAHLSVPCSVFTRGVRQALLAGVKRDVNLQEGRLLLQSSSGAC